jgi:hypothetical protein
MRSLHIGDWSSDVCSSDLGLDHYVRGGKEQEKIVEDLYLEVLKRLEKKK